MTNENRIELREKFVELISSINRNGKDDLLEWLNKSDFYTAPASTQYHGAFPGGLLLHSLSVYNTMAELHGFYTTSLVDYNQDEITEENMIITALLHDLCKVNCYEDFMRNVKNEQTGKWEQVKSYRRKPLFAMGHGGKSVFIIQQFMQLTAKEAQAIFWHMGAFDTSEYNTWNELSQAYKENYLAFLLHQADMTTTYLIEREN